MRIPLSLSWYQSHLEVRKVRVGIQLYFQSWRPIQWSCLTLDTSLLSQSNLGPPSDVGSPNCQQENFLTTLILACDHSTRVVGDSSSHQKKNLQQQASHVPPHGTPLPINVPTHVPKGAPHLLVTKFLSMSHQLLIYNPVDFVFPTDNCKGDFILFSLQQPSSLQIPKVFVFF